MTEKEKDQALQNLRTILNDNANQRLTLALVMGILSAYAGTLRTETKPGDA